jgi:hypothetical protein
LIKPAKSVEMGAFKGGMSVFPGNFSIMENLTESEGKTPLIESAIRLNEIYKSLMTGGFTEDEALSLIAKMTKRSD